MGQTNTSEPRVVSITSPTTFRQIRSFNPNTPIDALRVSSLGLFDVNRAREVSRWPAIKRMDIWCTTTKAGLRQLLFTPGLEEINLTGIKGHGSLDGMPRPTSVHTLRCSFLSSDDLLRIADLPDLQTLSAQYSRLSRAVIARLVGMQSLCNLDLEASNLNDDMASILSSSTRIVSLDIGKTRVGPKGLQRICQMSALRELDIWALDIQDSDLDMLAGLARLEYLSVGGYEGQAVLTA